jgi:hypothetical protein
MLSMETIPPPTISLPTSLLYHSGLQRSVLFTWVQLRGLAAQLPSGACQTPPLRVAQLAHLTGICEATLYIHLAVLRTAQALDWRPTGRGSLIVSFPAMDEPEPEPPDPAANSAEQPPANPQPSDLNSASAAPAPALQNSRILESAPLLSLTPPPQNTGRRRREKRHADQISRKPENKTELAAQASPGPPISPPGQVPRSPVALYRACMHLTLNAAQRQQVEETVSDPELWADSLDHWRTHGWNPRNLPGLLDFYSRGGPPMCRFCHPERQEDPRPSRPPRAPTPLESTLQAIAEIRAEQAEQNTCLPTPYPSSR